MRRTYDVAVAAPSQSGERARRGRPRLLADLSPLRNRVFRSLWIGWSVSAFGNQLTTVAVAYETYTLTHSTLMVGLVGLVQLVPSLVGSLWGGSLVDAKDRRALLIGIQFVLAATSAGFFLNARLGHPALWAIYGCVVLSAGVQAVNFPARSAIMSQTVDRDDLPAASALLGISNQFALIAGPAIAGILIATVGVAAAFAIDTATFGAVVIAALALPRLPPVDGGAPMGVRSVVEGLQYARRNRFLVSLLIIDFSSMVFGMPRAVFPALAVHLYHGGPGILGVLYAATGFGAFVASLCSGWVRHVHFRGRAVVACMVVWGVAITIMGVIPVAAVGVAMLAVAGAADMIGGVFRNTIWQTTVPTRFQGRLAGVFYGSAVGANSVGDGEAGVAAAIGGPLFALWSGGVLSLLGVVAVLWRFPELWRSTGRDLVDFDEDDEDAATIDGRSSDPDLPGGDAQPRARQPSPRHRLRARRTVDEATRR